MREAGLSQYVDVLLENGFEDIETLLELRDTDLEDLGFQRGHTLKMLKRLRQLGEQVGGGEAAPSCEEGGASVAGPAPKLPIATPPTAQMADAVQRSWAEVQKLGSDAVGDLLYKNLFKLAPDAVSLFPMHVRERYQHWLVDENSVSVELSPALRNLFGKIVGAVGYSVEHVGDIEKLKPALMALGARHFGYQCEASHYQVLQKALIETLGMALGELFTPEVEFAWTVVYGFMSSIMLEGQSQAEQVKKAAEEAADNISASGRFAATPTATGKPSLGGDETTVSTPSVATPTPEERPTILASMRNVGGPEPCTKRQSQVRPTPAALA